jgi:uncharacterized repeat protein (TIGR01451 family)
VIALSPDGRHAYVTSEGKGDQSQFAISPRTGKITPLSPADVTTPLHGSLALAVTPDADLSATLTAPATARTGHTLAYAIKVVNADPSDAWQAVLTDHLPAGTAFRSAATASGHCSKPRAGTSGATVKCYLAELKTATGPASPASPPTPAPAATSPPPQRRSPTNAYAVR